MQNSLVNKEYVFDLPKVEDERGNLSFLEVERHIPFPIERCYWIYDVPGGQERGSHAFRQQHEVIIALSGSFDVILHDGQDEKVYTLNRSYKALYVPNMMWRSLGNFSTNSVCLVLSSSVYLEQDYIRDFNEFLSLQQKAKQEVSTFPDILPKDKEGKYHTVFDCSLLELSVVKNRAGNITPVESNKNIPFDIRRVFYIYDIPSGAERGMHAHKHCHELLVATTGSFEVELDDGTNKRTIRLSSPRRGLHIPPGIWATEKEYSSGATCLALASDIYDTKGYIKSYEEFMKYRLHED